MIFWKAVTPKISFQLDLTTVLSRFSVGELNYMALFWSVDYKDLMQAILPLRGKILNIEKKDEAALYKNEEIQNLIIALGLGVKVRVCVYVL